jgi:hypothetical protein
MANPMKGEALVRVSTGEFTLAYNFAAAAMIEAEFGKPLGKVMIELQESQSVTDMMKVIWAGLKKHHGLSLDEVGDIVTMAEADQWGEAMGRAMANPDAASEGKQARPPKAKAR